MATVPVAARPAARTTPVARATWAIGLLGGRGRRLRRASRASSCCRTTTSAPVFQPSTTSRGWVDSNRQGNPVAGLHAGRRPRPDRAALSTTFQGVLDGARLDRA